MLAKNWSAESQVCFGAVQLLRCRQQITSRELWIPVNLPEKDLNGNVTGLSAFGWHHLACKCITQTTTLIA